MGKIKITLRNEEGQEVDSIKVENFGLHNIPKDWNAKHNYSIWFEDETQWDYEL